MNQLDRDWLNARVSLGAAAGWTAEEMRVVADLGYALSEQGRNQEALVIFEGLAALAPATAYFQSALGALRLRLGDLPQALKHLDAALDADRSDIAALTNRGETHLKLGNRRAAIEDLRRVCDSTPLQNAARGAVHIVRAQALLAQLLR